ncbi:M90 family metallopeptidase [Rubrivivax albus]|uniref:M90 family metallopeptidase n=1 Tax=Rubrivivax albus TaxID=2499835 RepID=UPI0018EE8923|nr:M90 family metallopeptidase [Rubrivivax albus]
MAPWIAVGVLLLALTALVGVFLGPAAWRRLRQARWRQQPFPTTWRRILRRRWPLYARLPPNLQARLRRQMLVLLAETPFVGCNGLAVTTEMRVLVAAQAALLRLRDDAGSFPNLREVLLYPAAFVVDRTVPDGAGLWRSERRVQSGESWQRGQVILSWPDVLAGAADPADGENVVIHEFAHQLDQQRGAATGAPFLGHRDRYPGWAAAFGTAFAETRQREAAGQRTLIGAYGASAPAEFFAVASERFFECPAALAQAHPALYHVLSVYYGVDPLAW